ncbi:MAG: hypothetical protein FJZ09_03140 [Candidatus Omnitrophica bacterium]|nr:hypothetical protein [Candidatus Omnitrophota bacterium]
MFCVVFPVIAQEEYKYDAKGKRDPFIQLVTPDGRLLKLDKEEQEEAKKGPLVIEGVIYDKHGRSYAIVNGLAVGVGDMVGDYQVLKVKEDKVIFIKEGKPLEVDFKKED